MTSEPVVDVLGGVSSLGIAWAREQRLNADSALSLRRKIKRDND